ncbi:polysaccharide pyruvyl transferase family protein [Acuticoccus sediminis]|uniref:polysaccharide pyruvyl transferase family protein n=1 Tax=Acuticoccus sediminis TaxID=2184697 RepID=UPI001CFD3573|nr:polysaccharide pyruvyl transferase family protein [Acuticoccus sediminis]
MRRVRDGGHLAFLGSPGAVADAGTLSTEALLARLGANAGNLMFQHAAPRLFAHEARHLTTLSGPEAEAVLADARALVFPAANHLRLGTDWTGLANGLARTDCPLVVLGLGSQAPSADGEAATVAALTRDPSVSRLAAVLAEKAVFVSVRGTFSQRVCEALGLTGTEPLGCPSLFLNPRPDLGRAVAWRLGKAREKGDAARIALAAAAPFEIQDQDEKLAAERVLFAGTVRGNGLYVQQSGGTAAAAMARGTFAEVPLSAVLSMRRILAPEMGLDDFVAVMRRRGRLFTDAARWIEAVKPFDAVFGTRLHGSMAALAAAVPGVVVTHDARTAELVETMALPTLTLAEVVAAGRVEAMLERVRFDAGRFDAGRRRIAAGLAAAFARIGLAPAEDIAELGR